MVYDGIGLEAPTFAHKISNVEIGTKRAWQRVPLSDATRARASDEDCALVLQEPLLAWEAAAVAV